MGDDWGQLIFKVHPVIAQPEPVQPITKNTIDNKPNDSDISIPDYFPPLPTTPPPTPPPKPAPPKPPVKKETKSIYEILRIESNEDTPWNSDGNPVFDDIISETINTFAHPLIYDDF